LDIITLYKKVKPALGLLDWAGCRVGADTVLREFLLRPLTGPLSTTCSKLHPSRGRLRLAATE